MIFLSSQWDNSSFYVVRLSSSDTLTLSNLNKHFIPDCSLCNWEQVLALVTGCCYPGHAAWGHRLTCLLMSTSLPAGVPTPAPPGLLSLMILCEPFVLNILVSE